MRLIDHVILSLVISALQFVCFEEDEIGRLRIKLYAKSRAKSHTRSYDHRFCD